MPRRRWVAATLTMVTPAAGTNVPPGADTEKVNAPAVPTHSSPSQTPIERSVSVSDSHSSRSCRASATPPKARSRLAYHRSHSDCRSTLRSVVICHPYQPPTARRDPISN
jgi:uncharacterized lipoprotein YajG